MSVLFFLFLNASSFLPGFAFAQVQKPIEKSEAELESLRKYGSYLFRISNCKDCHTEKNGPLLAGGVKVETEFGSFYGPNITPDKETGIGRWTDQDFIRAMRRGVSPSGRNYFPSFPYSSYSKMSDSDMIALKTYIFSLPAIKKESLPNEIKFPFNVREFVIAWKWINFRSIQRYSEDNFIKARGPYQFVNDKDWEWNRGAYLVEGPMHCTQCHTPRDKIGNFKWDQWMGGSKLYGSKKAAPNLTPDRKNGLGNWTASDWETFLVEGVSPNGTEVGGKMGKIVEEGTSRLTRADLRAVIKYLMSLKSVDSTELSKKEEL